MVDDSAEALSSLGALISGALNGDSDTTAVEIRAAGALKDGVERQRWEAWIGLAAVMSVTVLFVFALTRP